MNERPPRAPVLAGAAVIIAAVAAGGGSAPASPTSVRVGGGFYTIETTAAHYNVGSGAFVTKAPLRISRSGLDASADRGEGNTIAGTAVMHGNVRIHDAGGPASPQGAGAGAATLTCDELDVDARKDTYRAVGRAHYAAATRTAAADLMVLDRRHHTLHMDGNVTITDGDAAVHASTVDIDLTRHDAVATGSPVIITQPAPTPSASGGTSSTPPSVATTASPAPLK
jgi:lipopolysaccharide export system protein LptA